jgi:hypothetical protein
MGVVRKPIVRRWIVWKWIVGDGGSSDLHLPAI